MRFAYILAALATISTSIGYADTLTLRNGRTVQGSYLGGNSRQIRMAVGDAIQTFDVTDIATLQFEGAGTAAPAQAAAAAPSTQQAAAVEETPARPQRRILRADPAYTSQAAAPAQTTAAGEIPAGTNVTIRMIDDVDSDVATVGQTFRASIDEPVMVGSDTVIPRGADVLMKLIEMKDSSKLGGGGQLTLDMVSITVNGKPVDVVTEGVTTVGDSRKKETGAVIGGGAALGAIIGAIAGGGKGAAIGAVSGAGAGTAVQVLTKGKRVKVPSETRLTFTLQQPAKV